MAGRCVNPMMNAYVTSKFAMRAFSDCLRQEMQLWGVTVVLIEPWYVLILTFVLGLSFSLQFYEHSNGYEEFSREYR